MHGSSWGERQEPATSLLALLQRSEQNQTLLPRPSVPHATAVVHCALGPAGSEAAWELCSSKFKDPSLGCKDTAWNPLSWSGPCAAAWSQSWQPPGRMCCWCATVNTMENSLIGNGGLKMGKQSKRVSGGFSRKRTITASFKECGS